MVKDYKIGLGNTRYKEVPKAYRKLALLGSPEARAQRKGRMPSNPMTLDLLAGKTLFAYDPFLESGHRKAHGMIFSALYNIARRFGKTFRCVGYDFEEDGHFRGYIMWMENSGEARELRKVMTRLLTSLEDEIA